MKNEITRSDFAFKNLNFVKIKLIIIEKNKASNDPKFIHPYNKIELSNACNYISLKKYLCQNKIIKNMTIIEMSRENNDVNLFGPV